MNLTVPGSTELVLRAMTSTADGNFLVVGAVRLSDGTRDVVLVKLTPGGAIQWKKTLGTAGDDLISSISRVSDGYILVGGTKNASGDVDMLLLKLNLAGTVVWKETIGMAGVDYGYSSAILPDNGIVVIGKTGTTPILVKIHSDGSQEWAKKIMSLTIADEGLPRIAVTADGSLIFDVNIKNGDRIQTILGKVTGAGSLLWSRTVSSGTSLTSWGLGATNDGGVVISGEVGNGATGRGFVMKYRQDGLVQWKKAYSNASGENVLASVVALDNGMLAAVGCAQSSIVIVPVEVRLNPDGSILGGCSRLLSPAIASSVRTLILEGASIPSKTINLSVSSQGLSKSLVVLSSTRVCPVNVPPAGHCGNGVCDQGETPETCPQDCKQPPQPVCGNGKCESGETPQNCPQDCKSGPVCGNGKCESGETPQNCPKDCQQPACDPCYTGLGVCVPPAPPDHDCTELQWKDFHACPADPQGLDGDGDGIACES